MKNRVITISREFGSGGRTIGKKVAEKLSIPCYDSEIIQEMAKETILMVVKSIEAFVNRDLEQAQGVIEMDDIVDDLFISIKNELIQMINADQRNGEQATDLLMIGKYFERIGDHAVNIAQWVTYSITGEHGEIN